MLSEFEQRRLRAIEQGLVSEDPEFAERIQSISARCSGPQLARRWFRGIVAVGIALVLTGLVASFALLALGVVLVLAATWIRFLIAGMDGHDDRGDPGDGPQAGPGVAGSRV